MKQADLEGRSNSQIQDGRILHTKLDIFFDTSPLLAQSRKQLFGFIRHMQNPVLDVLSDYIIGSNWNSLFDGKIEDYVLSIHDIVGTRIPLFPHDHQQLAHALIEENWLLSHQEPTGLYDALTRLAYRSEKNGHIILDNRAQIINTVSDIEPLVLAAMPAIRKFSRDSMSELGYQAETRLRWREHPSLMEAPMAGLHGRR
jgi:acyl carrier protein phosphodiesterase